VPRRSIQRLLASTPVALALLAPSFARADELPEFIEEVHGQVENLMDAWSNYQACLARGADPSLCEALAIYCAIPGTGLIDDRAGMFSELDLFQVFKLDCGDGECYQCCFTGEGCHSSFIGFPVINCNLNYGPETRDVGITLITDPNAGPGSACLTTPQTCDHLSICLGDHNALADLRADLEGGLEHPLNLPWASEQRLRYFGRDFHDRWLAYLNRFHTGIPVEPDPEFSSFGKLVDIEHFLTGRGCVGWRDHVAAVRPYDWSGEHFAVRDGEGALSEPASQLNGVRLLGLMRMLDALPNLAGRHAAVESTVWPDADRDAYLARLDADADAAILRAASPIFLDLLRLNTKVRDYRLLAVPLADEAAGPARFNGCPLGAAPRVFASADVGGGPNGVLRLDLEDPEAGTEHAHDQPALIFWGDGTASRTTIAAGAPSASFEHAYVTPGRYAVHAVVENTSGLRGVASAIVEAAAAAAEASAPHIFTQVRVVDAVARVNVTSGNERKLFFQISGRDADSGEELLLGVGQERGIPFNADVPLGTLVGHNPAARTIDRITLRPAWRDGFYGIGWGGHFMTLARLELHVPSTSSDQPRIVPVPLTTDNVRVYPVGGDAPVDVEYLSTTEDGRTLLWLDSTFTAERIEIDVPAGLLASNAPGPLADGQAPTFASHVETRPGTFEPTELATDESGGSGDESRGDSSGSSGGSNSSGSGSDTNAHGDGGGCQCTAHGPGGALWTLAPLAWIVRRRRSGARR
jgi:uncharacterized protein (TIGR03382 family)